MSRRFTSGLAEPYRYERVAVVCSGKGPADDPRLIIHTELGKDDTYPCEIEYAGTRKNHGPLTVRVVPMDGFAGLVRDRVEAMAPTKDDSPRRAKTPAAAH